MLWTPSISHGFKVKNYYKILQAGEACPFPWKNIRKVKAPPRIAFSIWTTTLGRILTIDNLRRDGFTLVNSCCLCKQNEETVNRLLIHFEYTNDLWYMVLYLFGVSWTMLRNILELLHFWKNQGHGHSKEAILKVIPLFLMCNIWRKRICRYFEDCETPVFSLKSTFWGSLLHYAIVYVPSSSFLNLLDLINFLDFRHL